MPSMRQEIIAQQIADALDQYYNCIDVSFDVEATRRIVLEILNREGV